MSLQFKYVHAGGTYTFNADTTMIPLERAFLFDAQGRRDRERQTWRIRTVLQAATQDLITTAINSLQSAFANDDGTLTIIQEDNDDTPHEVASVKVLSIAYPEATGPEYANRRTVEITLEGTSEVSGKADDYVTFTESVSYRGGGPRYHWQETIEGKPQKCQVAEHTLYEATQRGSAVSKGSTYPDPPGPLFPGHELEANPELARTAERTEDGELRYRLDWVYKFASSEELVAEPNTWL